MLMKVAYICYNVFNFVVDSAHWDPNVTPPYNGISFVYAAVVSVFNTTYKISSEKKSPSAISSPVFKKGV
eukprot:11333544-Ditylum_brightwellii.AAC.1